MVQAKIELVVSVAVVFGAAGIGCSSQADLVAATTTTTSTSGPGSESESESESESSGPDLLVPDLPPESLCDCEPGSLCVADCEPTADFHVALNNFRCVGPPECSGEADDPLCLIEACEYSVATYPDCDGQTGGADIVCEPSYWLFLCRSLQQDCPVDEKCVLQILGWEQLYTGQCVLYDEPGAAVGEDCSSEGVMTGIDDCDAHSMCWNGEVSTKPFVGTCHGFCTLVDGQPTCPEGSTCEMIGPDDFYLCMPL